jgi:lipid A ethanolaminephosphotransferase
VEGRHTQYTGPLLDPGGPPQRASAMGGRPIVLFLVIGETARAANFELGGYRRPTNPELKSRADVVYFDKATSCGTSTATSVPCIFSPFRRTDFKLSTADHYVNLLDTLQRAGVVAEWRDNNAGCKGVCRRVATVYYPPRTDPQLCPNGYCFDEVMLKDLEEKLRHISRDTVIVFHQIGSHGPAYSQRYPAARERFEPVCRSNELHRCSPTEIVNAYDNSIAYTDFVLSRQIDLLLAAAGTADGVLLYASDHGESLGEDGVYLHGMPYAIAPKVQTEIPMLLWTSAGYRSRVNLDAACLSGTAHRAASHDNIYHTALGVFGVRNKVYADSLDLLATCRRTP